MNTPPLDKNCRIPRTDLNPAPPKRPKKNNRSLQGSLFFQATSMNPLSQIVTSEIDINAKDEHGNTALMTAAHNKNAQEVVRLIKEGADVKIKNKSGTTALHFLSNHPEAIRLLIAKGADVNAVNKLGNTPLYWAVGMLSSNNEAVEILLSHGANIHILNSSGETILYAAVKSHSPSLKSLIKYGASFNNQNKDGRTPLHLFLETENLIHPDRLNDFKFMLSQGADIFLKDHKGRSPLFNFFFTNMRRCSEFELSYLGKNNYTYKIYTDEQIEKIKKSEEANFNLFIFTLNLKKLIGFKNFVLSYIHYDYSIDNPNPKLFQEYTQEYPLFLQILLATLEKVENAIEMVQKENSEIYVHIVYFLNKKFSDKVEDFGEILRTVFTHYISEQNEVLTPAIVTKENVSSPFALSP